MATLKKRINALATTWNLYIFHQKHDIQNQITYFTGRELKIYKKKLWIDIKLETFHSIEKSRVRMENWTKVIELNEILKTNSQYLWKLWVAWEDELRVKCVAVAAAASFYCEGPGRKTNEHVNGGLRFNSSPLSWWTLFTLDSISGGSLESFLTLWNRLMENTIKEKIKLKFPFYRVARSSDGETKFYYY